MIFFSSKIQIFMGSIRQRPAPPRAFFSPTSRGKFLDLRPALDRARRAAYDRRVFCERTPTISEKSKKKKLKKKSTSDRTVRDMHQGPQLPNQTPRGA